MDELVGLEDDFSLAILEWCNEDPVAIEVINHKDVAVALAGRGWKLTGEVHVSLASG